MSQLPQRRRKNPPTASNPPAQTFADRLAAALGRQTGGGASPDAVLLLDLSGSMWGWAGANQTKLEALAELVAKLPPVRRFGFASDVSEIPGSRGILDAAEDFGTGTDMQAAFEHLTAAGLREVVLITDGHPTSPEADTLQAAQGLKLHIFYVGPEPVPDFLKLLARRTGGQFHQGSLEIPLALETKIRGLLGGPSGREAIKL